jgi:5-methylcytosine-specific restriction enzyme subunit McrC
MTGLQATLNAFHPERFQCEYDEFTVDTPVNRVLKAAVRRLRRVTRHDDNARCYRRPKPGYFWRRRLAAREANWGPKAPKRF